MMQTTTFRGVVINGQTTYFGLPVFNWSTAPQVFNTTPHALLSNSYAFIFEAYDTVMLPATSVAPITAFPTTLYPNATAPPSDNFWTMQNIIIVAVCGGVAVIIAAIVITYCCVQRRDGDRYAAHPDETTYVLKNSEPLV